MPSTKVDVAVNSYRKPLLLIHTLLSLKRACGDRIDTVWIADDCSGGDVADLYRSEAVRAALAPIRLRVRVNRKRAGYGRRIFTWGDVRGGRPRSLADARRFLKAALTGRLHHRHDIRYQWALDETDKRRLFVVHDDVVFVRDVIGLYGAEMDRLAGCAVVGDLGQCWICGYADRCSPSQLLAGERPSPHWPRTPSPRGPLPKRWELACRVNEWCCLLDVAAARRVERETGVQFGNYYPGADIGAKWFEAAVTMGYRFSDPLPGAEARAEWYRHAWLGHSGHAAWVDPGRGRVDYRDDALAPLLEATFGFKAPPRPVAAPNAPPER